MWILGPKGSKVHVGRVVVPKFWPIPKMGGFCRTENSGDKPPLYVYDSHTCSHWTKCHTVLFVLNVTRGIRH